MNNVLLITAAAIAITSTAQADVTFVKGTASATYSIIEDFSDLSIIDTDFAAAFSLGTYGFQFGANNTSYDITNGPSLSMSGNDAHLYRQGANGAKYGVYMGSTSVFGYSMTSYGVEGMFNVGPADLEVYAGVVSGDFFWNDLSAIGVKAYFDVTSALEISAAYDSISETGNSPFTQSFYTLGASYEIPNTNLSATAIYQSFDNISEAIMGVGVEWSFGPKQEERLFGSRNFTPMSTFMFEPT